MNGLLIDENLPKSLVLPSVLPVYHATDFGENPTDTELWNLASERALVVITKDADFSNRILLGSSPPWIVHLRLGNLRLKELIQQLTLLWPEVEVLLPRHKLVTVLHDRIEAVA